MHYGNFTRRAALACATTLFAVGASAQGSDWPARQPIRFIVPGPAGGAMDVLLRVLQTPLQEALKQSIVIDYKPGANSIIGIDAVAKASPDGYTWVIAPSSAVAINPVIQANLPFNVERDLAPVAQLGAGGILLMTNPNTGFKNLADMVAHARANPGKVAYASWGSGSTGHLAMEGIKAHYGLDMPHVPYKTTAQEITDLLANNIGIAFTDVVSPIPHVRSGKLVALAATGSGRPPALPDVPTVSEQGFKFDADGWFGVFTAASVPPSIVARMNQELGNLLAQDEVKARFAQMNLTLQAFKTPSQFAATVKTDTAFWQDLAKKAKLKID